MVCFRYVTINALRKDDDGDDNDNDNDNNNNNELALSTKYPKYT
jgi:hypothetical protein